MLEAYKLREKNEILRQVKINCMCGMWYPMANKAPEIKKVLKLHGFYDESIEEKTQDEEIEMAKFWNIRGPFTPGWGID